MKLLVTGAKGQLGWELMRHAAEGSFSVTGVDLPEVDLCEDAQVAQTFEAARPDLVINAAAYTNVDGAESERALCYRVNEAVPRRLAVACRRAGIPLLVFEFDMFDPRVTSYEDVFFQVERFVNEIVYPRKQRRAG